MKSAAKAAKPAGPKQSQQGGRPDRQLVEVLKGVAATREPIVGCYAAHVVDPEHTKPCGIPVQDIGATDTGLVTSKMSFDISVNCTTLHEPGRFGFVVQPHLGDAASPIHSKIAPVNTLVDWPADLTQTASYLKQIGGQPLTVDKASKTCIEPGLSYYEGQAQSSSLIQSPFGDETLYNTRASTNDTQNPNFGVPATVFWPTTNTNAITLSPGQWLLVFDAAFAAANGNASNIVLTPVNPGSVSVSTQTNSVGALTTSTSLTCVVSVYDQAQTINVSWDNFPTVPWTMSYISTSSWARPDQLTTPALRGYPKNGGMFREYCPVAMSVLATFTAPGAYIGGEIGIATVAPNTCAANVFTNMPNADTGNPLYVEKLRDFPMAYSGELKKGAYGVWMPSGRDDMMLRDPDTQARRDWPCVVVSGLVNVAGVAPPSDLKILRVTVVTTYQYSTNLKLFPLEKRLGSTAAMEEALRLLMTFPRASANGTHIENIKSLFGRFRDVFKKAQDFYGDNKFWINPAVTTLGGFLL